MRVWLWRAAETKQNSRHETLYSWIATKPLEFVMMSLWQILFAEA